RRDLSLPELDLVVAARDFFPDRPVGAQRLAALIDLANLDRLADFQRPAVRLLLTRDHPEERRLSGAVGADDADDAAARQREVEIVDEHVIAVALSKMPRLDDEVAEAWPGGDVDFSGVDFLRGFF